MCRVPVRRNRPHHRSLFLLRAIRPWYDLRRMGIRERCTKVRSITFVQTLAQSLSTIVKVIAFPHSFELFRPSVVFAELGVSFVVVCRGLFVRFALVLVLGCFAFVECCCDRCAFCCCLDGIWNAVRCQSGFPWVGCYRRRSSSRTVRRADLVLPSDAHASSLAGVFSLFPPFFVFLFFFKFSPSRIKARNFLFFLLIRIPILLSLIHI